MYTTKLKYDMSNDHYMTEEALPFNKMKYHHEFRIYSNIIQKLLKETV